LEYMSIFHIYLWLEFGCIHAVKVLRNMHAKINICCCGTFFNEP
jgi:hypothetical protein